MSTLLDELERLGGMALMRPWHAERNASGYHAATSTSGIRVFSGADKPDADYITAAVNALPALLRVARAAQAWRQAEHNYYAWFRDDEAPLSAGDTLDEALTNAERELEEALDALESGAIHV